MGCSASKAGAAEPVPVPVPGDADDAPADPKDVKLTALPVGIGDESPFSMSRHGTVQGLVSPYLRSRLDGPLPPAKKACDAFVLDPKAAPCLDCGKGWLMATVSEGEHAGFPYFFSSDGTTSWQRPAGKKEAPEPTCLTCGCLKAAHSPCLDYQVNMSAAVFGECNCGFTKEVHLAGAFVKDKVSPRKSRELCHIIPRKAYCDCERYEVNLESLNFGECKW